jgi:hypothetical protein
MTITLITLLVLSFVVNIALYIGSQRALSKIAYYENFIYDRFEAYKSLLSKIRQLDAKQLFEKDDDVGVTFTEIKTEIEEFGKLME